MGGTHTHRHAASLYPSASQELTKWRALMEAEGVLGSERWMCYWMLRETVHSSVHQEPVVWAFQAYIQQKLPFASLICASSWGIFCSLHTWLGFNWGVGDAAVRSSPLDGFLTGLPQVVWMNECLSEPKKVSLLSVTISIPVSIPRDHIQAWHCASFTLGRLEPVLSPPPGCGTRYIT